MTTQTTYSFYDYVQAVADLIEHQSAEVHQDFIDYHAKRAKAFEQVFAGGILVEREWENKPVYDIGRLPFNANCIARYLGNLHRGPFSIGLGGMHSELEMKVSGKHSRQVFQARKNLQTEIREMLNSYASECLPDLTDKTCSDDDLKAAGFDPTTEREPDWMYYF